MNICDTHAHYDDEAFDLDREQLLGTELEKSDVELVVNVGASMQGANASVLLAQRYPIVYAACGIHPDDVGILERGYNPADSDSDQPDSCSNLTGSVSDQPDSCSNAVDSDSDPEGSCSNPAGSASNQTSSDRHLADSDSLRFLPPLTPKEAMAYLRKLCTQPKTVCVGEIGLDYHWMVEPKEIQAKWFREQMKLACELKLPINVHSRDAAQDTYDLIRENYDAGRFTGGIIHCYSGSLELAREYVKMGYYLGIGGVVTFKNGKVLKKVVSEIGIEHLVTETDCPYLAPEPYRGKRNDSRNIRFVIEKIAELKGIDIETCAAILHSNAHAVYHV